MEISDAALVLVVVIKSPRDMEIARLLGWYRIPIRSAPKVVDVDFLAFYQTAAFGSEQRWQIEWIAEVNGHELTTRRDLFREEPNHPRANEEYYKLQLSPLFPLPQPIRAKKWKRLTFLYTTGERLASASDLHDLVVNDEERSLLWQALRERADKQAYYSTGEMPLIPDDALWSLLDFIK